MPSVYNQVLLHWVDINNRPATTFWTTQDQDAGGAGSYAELAAAAQALSVAAVTAVQLQTTLILDASAVSGDYQSVTDRAVFLSRITVGNQPSVIAIPGPKADIFGSSGEIVDMSNTDVIAFSAAVMSFLGDTNGNANGPLIRGTRQRARGG